MSRTYSIVCKETQCGVWIGQGPAGEGLTVFYCDERKTMVRLGRFLAAHIGRPLVVMDDEHVAVELDNYQEFEGEPPA